MAMLLLKYKCHNETMQSCNLLFIFRCYYEFIKGYLCEFHLVLYFSYLFQNYYNIYFLGMESGGSNHSTGNKRRSRQAWTKDEEEALLNILVVVVAKGG